MAKNCWICEKCGQPYAEQAEAERCELMHYTAMDIQLTDLEYENGKRLPTVIIIQYGNDRKNVARYRLWSL